MDEAIARLVRRTPDGSLVWVTDLLVKDNTTSNYLEHLVGLGRGQLIASFLCLSGGTGCFSRRLALPTSLGTGEPGVQSTCQSVLSQTGKVTCVH